MARKIGQPKPPPLSALDGALYALLLLLCFAWMVCSAFLHQHLQAVIAGLDGKMRMWDNTAWGWMAFPICSSITGAVVFAIWHPMPLIGNPKVRYGNYPYHEYAPLFSRTLPLREHRPAVYSEKCRQTRVALAAFVLALLLGLPGLCPRDVLMADGSMAHYNVLNRCTETIPASDVRSVTFTARHGSGRSGEFFNFRVSANGNSFYSTRFAQDDAEAGLRFLIDYRAQMEARGVPVAITAEDPISHLSVAALLPKIAADQNYGDAEARLLYALFDGA